MLGHACWRKMANWWSNFQLKKCFSSSSTRRIHMAALWFHYDPILALWGCEQLFLLILMFYYCYIYIYIVIIFFKWNSILKIILKILKIFFIKYFINNLTYKNFNKIKIIIVFYQHIAWHFSFLVWLYLIDIN